MGSTDGDATFGVSGFGKGVAFNSTDGEYLAVWTSDDDTDFGNGPLINQEFEIFGQRFDPSTPLPVELVSFDAAPDGSAVLLRWETASETNNAGFCVEHRPEGEALWKTLDFVEGHGTTRAPRSYRYRAETPAPGRHRFRLKQIDFDGTFAYSPEVETTLELAERFALTPLYPNPFNPEAHFTLAVGQTQRVEVAVYDVLGRRVALLFDGSMAANAVQRFRLDGTALAGGTYVIRVEGEHFSAAARATLLK